MKRQRSIVAGLALVGLVAVATTGAAVASGPGTNGRMVFTAELGKHTQLFTVEPDGSGLKQVTSFKDSDAVNANWSPDGKRIVFERDFAYGHAGIYTIDADGGNLEELTRNSKRLLFEGSPAFSPDGKRIVFARVVCLRAKSTGPKDRGALWTMSAAGGTARRVTPWLATGKRGDHYYDGSHRTGGGSPT